MRKGALLIISAPSGAGKTTICRKLLARRKDLRYSISCTTRSPRLGEKDGKAYFFLDRDEFKRRIARHEFLEWAMVHDEYYGTPRHFVDSVIKTGDNVIMAIDVQGAMSIRRKHHRNPCVRSPAVAGRAQVPFGESPRSDRGREQAPHQLARGAGRRQGL